MYAIESSQADLDLVATLLSSRSSAEAAIAFSLLRGTISDSELVTLANLRSLVSEIPDPPFRTGESLELLERAGHYEYTGRSYRRMFESSHGVFGIEFLGENHSCDGIVVHTATSRYTLKSHHGDSVDEAQLALFVNHSILLDAVIEALKLLGCQLDPMLYVSADDFVSEHAACAATVALDELF
jgi:hypothetical protein